MREGVSPAQPRSILGAQGRRRHAARDGGGRAVAPRYAHRLPCSRDVLPLLRPGQLGKGRVPAPAEPALPRQDAPHERPRPVRLPDRALRHASPRPDDRLRPSRPLPGDRGPRARGGVPRLGPPGLAGYPFAERGRVDPRMASPGIRRVRGGPRTPPPRLRGAGLVAHGGGGGGAARVPARIPELYAGRRSFVLEGTGLVEVPSDLPCLEEVGGGAEFHGSFPRWTPGASTSSPCTRRRRAGSGGTPSRRSCAERQTADTKFSRCPGSRPAAAARRFRPSVPDGSPAGRAVPCSV